MNAERKTFFSSGVDHVYLTKRFYIVSNNNNINNNNNKKTERTQRKSGDDIVAHC